MNENSKGKTGLTCVGDYFNTVNTKGVVARVLNLHGCDLRGGDDQFVDGHDLSLQHRCEHCQYTSSRYIYMAVLRTCGAGLEGVVARTIQARVVSLEWFELLRAVTRDDHQVDIATRAQVVVYACFYCATH